MDVGGIVNTVAHAGRINNVGDLAAAYGIGSAAGAAAYFTGGAALSATGLAGASVAGGAVAGLAGSAVASPISGFGNQAYFGDPYSLKDFGRDVAIGTIGGAIIGGTMAGFKGKNIWTGADVAPGRGIFSFNNKPIVQSEAIVAEFPGGNRYVNGELVSGEANWTINHKGNIDNYLSKRGWTFEQIQETLNNGQIMEYNGTNYINPGNPVIRIQNLDLNKSLIYDPIAKQIIQLGQPGFKWK